MKLAAHEQMIKRKKSKLTVGQKKIISMCRKPSVAHLPTQRKPVLLLVLMPHSTWTLWLCLIELSHYASSNLHSQFPRGFPFQCIPIPFLSHNSENVIFEIYHYLKVSSKTQNLLNLPIYFTYSISSDFL